MVAMYFLKHITSYWLISTSKCRYLESYGVKRDFVILDFTIWHSLKKTPTYAFHNGYP